MRGRCDADARGGGKGEEGSRWARLIGKGWGGVGVGLGVGVHLCWCLPSARAVARGAVARFSEPTKVSVCTGSIERPVGLLGPCVCYTC